MHTRRPAFTLIELMVVIVIIALLTAIATASFISALQTSRDNAKKTTVNSIATAVETYYRDKHTFPGQATASSNITESFPSAPCQKLDSGPTPATVSYSYVPNQNCSGNGATAPFLTGDTASTWIPGLGSYMSSTPVDKEFLDKNGVTYDQVMANQKPTLGEDWTAADGTSDVTRTYTYRLLSYTNGSFGYIIYTRLENNSSDTVQGPITGTTTSILTKNPTQDPTASGTTNGNVYAVYH